MNARGTPGVSTDAALGSARTEPTLDSPTSSVSVSDYTDCTESGSSPELPASDLQQQWLVHWQAALRRLSRTQQLEFVGLVIALD